MGRITSVMSAKLEDGGTKIYQSGLVLTDARFIYIYHGLTIKSTWAR